MRSAGRSQRSVRFWLAAICGATLVLLGSLAPPGAVAADNVISLEVAASDSSKGDSVSVAIVSHAGVEISGASASIVFDRGRLELLDVVIGREWLEAGATVVGLPAPSATDDFVAAVNGAGKVPVVAAFFVDGVSLPAGSHELLTVTFRVLSCGESRIELPAGAEGVLLDGRKDSYGKTLEVTAVGGTIEAPCQGGETPAPSVIPAPGAPAGDGVLTSGSCPMHFRAEGGNLVDWILVEAEGPFEKTPRGYWSDMQIQWSTSEPLAHLRSGQVEVAGSDRRLNYYGGESDDLYAWRIGTDRETDRPLYLAVRKFTVSSRISPDHSSLVSGDDFINYMHTPAGLAHVAAVGFTPRVAPASPPIPDFDVDLNGVVALGDLGEITGHWADTSICTGWIRADADNNGVVALGDLGVVTGRWGGVGFVAPPATPAPGTKFGFHAYTFDDDTCTGNRKDPLNFFYSGPTLGTVAGALDGTEDVLRDTWDMPAGDQWFVINGNCSIQQFNRLTAPAPPRYHTRLSSAEGGVVASPQHHDNWGACVPPDVADTFNGARDHAKQLWQGKAGVTISTFYWGNTDAMRQCDGRYTASDGRYVMVSK